MSSMDIRDVMLEATANVQGIMEELKQQILEPFMLDALRMKWAQTPDEMKELIKQSDEASYQRLISIINSQ